jgi:hypothetical protein
MNERSTGSSPVERPGPDGLSRGSGTRFPFQESRLLLLPFVLLSFLAFLPALRGFYRLDDIDILFGASRVGEEISLLRWLFLPHNEHLVPLAKAEFFFFWKVFGIQASPFFLFLVVEVLVIQYLLWRLSERWFRTVLARLALAGLFGTTSLYVECAVWPLAGGFFTALILSLVALLGVDRYLETDSKTGLLMCLGGSLLAPMGSLAGAPTGAWVLLYALFGGGCGRNASLQRKVKPAAAGLLGMAAYLTLYLFFARTILQPGALGDRKALAVDIPEALRLTVLAVGTRQWTHLLFSPFGLVLAILVIAVFILLRGGRRRDLLIGFLAWSTGNLLFVYLFRSFAGPESIAWGRYHLYATVGTAGLAALALDEVLSRLGRGAGSSWLRTGVAAGGVLLLLANAAGTARLVNRKTQETRILQRFCLEWRKFPEAYSRSDHEKPLQIVDVEVRIPHSPVRELSVFSSVCWSRDRDWNIVWTEPGAEFSRPFREFLLESNTFPIVRNVLGVSSLPDTVPNRSP